MEEEHLRNEVAYLKQVLLEIYIEDCGLSTWHDHPVLTDEIKKRHEKWLEEPR